MHWGDVWRSIACTGGCVEVCSLQSLRTTFQQLLLAHGAPLYLKNADQKTACDLAIEGKQLIISKLLESKMVLVQVCIRGEGRGRGEGGRGEGGRGRGGGKWGRGGGRGEGGRGRGRGEGEGGGGMYPSQF